MKIIPLLLIVFIVPAVLNFISVSATKHTSGTIDNFVMRPGGALAGLGLIGAGFFLLVIIIACLNGQFEGGVAAVLVIFFIMCSLLILAPVKGFWDVTVDGDRMTSSHLWVAKKTINIKEIDHLEETRGGFVVYGLDGRKVMTIDGMSTNFVNLEKRLQKEGIEIR